MIISPPILKTAQGTRSDEAWLNELMSSPNTEYPVTQMLAWHGGMHIANAGNTEYVRAIADGTIVYVRPPSPPTEETVPPLNYDGRTSDGCIIIRHDTEIGEGLNSVITFYSIYMHLNAIYTEKLRIEVRESTVNGRRVRTNVDVFVKAGSKVYRKDKLGTVGYCGNDVEMHFEIICSQANLEKIVGRIHNDLNQFIQRDGRMDAVYGDMHFYIPASALCYSPNPVTSPIGGALPNGTPDLMVTMRFEKGKTILTTRRADLQRTGHYVTIGTETPENDSEYNLYKKATDLANTNTGIAASAIYELLRFGRVINTANETAIPAGSVKHWRKINLPNGQGWVDLNAVNIKKYSDADFPPWAGWMLISDDSTPDSQCNSGILKAWLDTNNDQKIKTTELQQALANAENKNRLAKTICKFPTEWAKASIATRYQWTKTQSDLLETPLNTAMYDKLEKHIDKLSFWEVAKAGAPANAQLEIEDSHWHFNAREFIQHFRTCGWLGEKEWSRLIPKNVIRKMGSHRSSGRCFWEQPSVSVDSIRRHYKQLNYAINKYLVSNSVARKACFLGNAIQETTWLSTTEESNGSQPNLHLGWYGRGFLQLTNPGGGINNGNNNYYKYFTYIGNRPSVPPGGSEIQWRNQVASSSFHAANSAGAYWVWSDGVKENSNKYADEPCLCTRQNIATNQGSKAWYYSRSFSKCAASVNLPSQINVDPPNSMNGLIDRHSAYTNALMILGEPLFNNDGDVVTQPDYFFPRIDS